MLAQLQRRWQDRVCVKVSFGLVGEWERGESIHSLLTKCRSKLKKTCPFAKSLSKVLVVLVFTRLVRSRTVGSKKREEIAIDSSIKLPGTFRAHHKLQIVGICNTRQELYRLEYVYLVHCNRLLS